MLFACRVDDAPLSLCDPTTELTGLTPGSHTLTVAAVDKADNIDQSPATRTFTVQSQSQFDFTGFFTPVDNPPVTNAMKGGSSVPVKFKLGGDRGLDIFAAGIPGVVGFAVRIRVRGPAGTDGKPQQLGPDL